MKQSFIFILLLLCLACSESEPVPSGTLSVRVRQVDSNGDKAAPAALWIWPASSPGYSIDSPLELIQRGWARDSQGVPQNYLLYQERFIGVFQNDLPEGQYFIVVMLLSSPEGRYSATVVNIPAADRVERTKVFTGFEAFQFETW